MKRNPTNRTWLALTGYVLLAVVVAVAGTLPASAARPVKSKGPEETVGGLTKAERLAHQRALHEDLAARMPAGATNAPVFVDITQEDRDAIDAPVASAMSSASRSSVPSA